jgi:hypothetical protein
MLLVQECHTPTPSLYSTSNEQFSTIPNPILDSGAPNSVGGTHSAAALASSLGVTLEFRPPTNISSVGWGINAADVKSEVCIWVAPLMDLLGQCYHITFHLISGTTPLLIGDDVLSNADILNTSKLSIIRIRADHLQEPAQFLTYSQLGRRYLEAVPTSGAAILIEDLQNHAINTFLSTHALAAIECSPETLARRIHRYSHASYNDMRTLIRRAFASHLKPYAVSIDVALRDVVAKCDVCVRVGRPKPGRKLSITRLVSNFNDSVQVDFLFVQLSPDEHISVIFHMVDASTAYSETSLVTSRDLVLAAAALKIDGSCTTAPQHPSVQILNSTARKFSICLRFMV